MFMNKAAKQTFPKFNTEAQEREYWESCDSSEHVDWSKAQKVKLPNLRSNAVDPVTTGRSPSAPADTAHRTPMPWLPRG